MTARGLVHDAIFLTALPGFIPLVAKKLLTKSGREEIKRGILPRFGAKSIKDASIIVHSSSLGETKNALIFSEILSDMLSEDGVSTKIKHTVFTKTAEDVFSEVSVIPVPLYLVMRNFLPDNIKILIFFESDFWPSYILSAKEKGAKVMVVSGKMSEKSSLLYRISGMRAVFSQVDIVFSSSEKNAERFRKAGFPRVKSSENFKNLIFLRKRKERKRRKKRSELFYLLRRIISSQRREGNKVVLGISLRGKEEVSFMLDAFLLTRETSLFFLAPRHNFDEAERLIQKRGINFTKLSTIGKDGLRGKIILVDMYGVIDDILEFSDFSFVGGSIVKSGGHNVLEPLASGVPVATGPNIWNIEEKEKLIKKGILHVVGNPAEFSELVKNSDALKKKVKKFAEEKSREVEEEMRKVSEEVKRMLNV